MDTRWRKKGDWHNVMYNFAIQHILNDFNTQICTLQRLLYEKMYNINDMLTLIIDIEQV